MKVKEEKPKDKKDTDRYLELQNELEEKSRELEKVTLQAITTVANTIDAKDDYTKGHSLRVSEYASAIAEAMGWSERDVQNIRYIALLHDIGKIGVPDSVLNKPGRLTENEFNLVKEHTVLGSEILKDISIIPDLDCGAKYHHERFDGGGYPSGISGHNIPVVARIIGIADAYDAMTSNRIYRKKMKKEQVREELISNSGTQFDPEILDVFLKLVDEGRFENVNNITESADMTSSEQLMIESNKLLQKIFDGQREQERKNAEVDYLTGIYNRRGAEKRIIARMQVSSGALVLIDLDNFKKINDIYGHIIGDEVLILVAKVISDTEGDIVAARNGGDEFILYINDVDDEAQVTEIMDDLIMRFRNACHERDYLESVSISAGVVMSMNSSGDYIDLMIKADKALYHVKQNGKDDYCFFHERSISDSSFNESRVDLSNVLGMLMGENKESGAYKVESRNFSRTYDMIANFASRNNLNVELILFTVRITDMQEISMYEHDDIMLCMEKAIFSSLRSCDVGTQYSGNQYIVALANCSRDNVKKITERIMRNFYKMSGRHNVVLDYDSADLKAYYEKNKD